MCEENLQYLVDTPNLGLRYSKETTFDLHGFSNADFATSKVDRKSTRGSCQFFGSYLAYWFARKKIQLLYQLQKLSIL